MKSWVQVHHYIGSGGFACRFLILYMVDWVGFNVPHFVQLDIVGKITTAMTRFSALTPVNVLSNYSWLMSSPVLLVCVSMVTNQVTSVSGGALNWNKIMKGLSSRCKRALLFLHWCLQQTAVCRFLYMLTLNAVGLWLYRLSGIEYFYYNTDTIMMKMFACFVVIRYMQDEI